MHLSRLTADSDLTVAQNTLAEQRRSHRNIEFFDCDVGKNFKKPVKRFYSLKKCCNTLTWRFQATIFQRSGILFWLYSWEPFIRDPFISTRTYKTVTRHINRWLLTMLWTTWAQCWKTLIVFKWDFVLRFLLGFAKSNFLQPGLSSHGKVRRAHSVLFLEKHRNVSEKKR